MLIPIVKDNNDENIKISILDLQQTNGEKYIPLFTEWIDLKSFPNFENVDGWLVRWEDYQKLLLSNHTWNIGDIHRFSSSDKLANYAGVASLRFSSAGKGKDVQNKLQGNRKLYSTLYFLAIQQIYLTNKGEPRNPAFRAYFERKVSEGKTKIQALLCIMRKLVKIIYSMMKQKTVYKLPKIEEKIAS